MAGIIYHCNRAVVCDHPTPFILFGPLGMSLLFHLPENNLKLLHYRYASRAADRSSVTLDPHSLEFPHETLLEIEVQ